ncbi:MAG TPA: PLP-dependent aminotransferase family protein, partial [Acidocella sp.]|nr:PLP-dependent aminotransferase family protein [Acidocella sp.]
MPDGTLVTRLMGEIRGGIAARTLAPGTRLPSIRAQALARNVSKTTVVEAYDRLAAEGVIESRRGSGFYVAGRLPPLSLAEAGPKREREMDPLWVSRQSLEMPGDALKPGCGWLPPSWMPEASLRRALRGLSRAQAATLTDYGNPRGPAPLREHLARRLGGFGVAAAPGQILLTDSGTQAADLLCRFLLEPGDSVLVDDPCYFNFRALLRAHRVKLVSVPYTPSGPDLDAFARILETARPRLYITNCAVHNPTGAALSPVTAHRLLKLAELHGLIIIEDDIFADFEAEPSPRLAAFDGLERVVQIGSFSKTLSASIRCGYIAARQDWVEGLTDLKIATSFTNGQFSAELLLAVLQDGTYRKHVEGLRVKL